ncbi:TonB-dependent receptor [Solimonas marina]|uniref:TonB-dependent receptor plug domain-containing protein n=1 Tax=Solimonas marina TaxID=2714601 RepID=A0A969WDY2_9GAMM|nr:TonB-dependent receptor [Solimonas marina]NKF24310.1 TonB-dependent receptor plug domain-containing protein [Solimonas marina]
MSISLNARRCAPRALPRRHLIAAAVAAFTTLPAHAQNSTELPDVAIDSQRPATPLDGTLSSDTKSADALRRDSVGSSDTAGLLDDLPGVASFGAGGVSSLPTLRGLSDDRVKIAVDGVQIADGCPNHMNPPLSYTDPQTIKQITVMAGITPVSAGGDSIGGTIAVETADPRFAVSGQTLFGGSADAFYRSNGDGVGGAITAVLANDRWHADYAGSAVRSRNYEAGDGSTVHSTEYEKFDQTLNLATQNDYGLFELQGGVQHAPYEGFPNQYMDMTFNRSVHTNGRWRDIFGWGSVDASAYYRNIQHKMNFLKDKGGTDDGGMPMNTNVRTAGYVVKADILLSARNTLRVGNELQRISMNDYWPPVDGSMMMGPDTFVNVNGGHRTRLGTYAELQSKWNPQWTTLFGVRNDTVWMNTGDVQPYSTTSTMSAADAAAAETFNAQSHKKHDINVDATALLRYQASEMATIEFGYAHKTRSPNLYERYAWGRGSMSSRMIGWFGDGNGYVGNLDLDPEQADTVSATLQLDGHGKMPWSLRMTPYYTYVHDYIDVQKLADLSNGFSQLQFTNVDAELYGLDMKGALRLTDSSSLGRTELQATASWTRGKNRDDGGSLYHQMPLNATLALHHELGGWHSQVELQMVDAKHDADATRVEPKTGGYTLLNLATRYAWQHYHVDVGVDNAFDKQYALPLGGQSIGDFDATGVLRPVPGRGRSFNVGLGLTF